MYNSIYPNYTRYYPGFNNRQIKQKNEDERSSRQSQNAENVQNKDRGNQAKAEFPAVDPSSIKQIPKPSGMVFPNGEKSAIDYTKKQINITHVLSDFRNTANAIGTPDDIKSEVESYLNLVKSQSLKENPNAQIIQSNLRNASQILDEYITKTLQKPSKVVENWVDALFLQQIDYKTPTEDTKPDESPIQTAAAENIPQEEPAAPEQSKPKSFYIPKDKHLKSMFIQAKKYSAIDDKEKALFAFQDVAEYAEGKGDFQAAAIAYYEQGRLYDEFNQPEDALFSFNKAATDSKDNNIKARAHLLMGKIYDDYVNFEPAVNHYCAAVSFAGESDNINLQTKALSDLTTLHANRYDKEGAFLFMNLAQTAAEETNNNRTKGITLSESAKCCDKLNEKARALEYYGQSAELYAGENYFEGLANDYAKAGDIMLEYGNKAKAKKLYSKAFLALQKCDNPILKQEVIYKISSL